MSFTNEARHVVITGGGTLLSDHEDVESALAAARSATNTQGEGYPYAYVLDAIKVTQVAE